MRLIDADKGLISKIQRETGCNFITAQKIVDSMSAVEERKVGKWIVHKDTICCPFCNTKQKIGTAEVELLDTIFTSFKFCKYCGAEMVSYENG